MSRRSTRVVPDVDESYLGCVLSDMGRVRPTVTVLSGRLSVVVVVCVTPRQKSTEVRVWVDWGHDTPWDSSLVGWYSLWSSLVQLY